MAQTTAGTHIEIVEADGGVIPLMLVRGKDDNGELLPAQVVERLSAASADSPVADWLEPDIQEDWSRGVGLDYNEAPGVSTRYPGYAIPAGAATQITIPAANNSNSPLVAIEEYGGDLFIAQSGSPAQANSARVIRSAGGGNTFVDSLNLAAGRILRDLVLFSGRLYAFSTNSSATRGEVHYWDGTVWSASSATLGGGLNAGGTATGRNRTVKVFWRTPDGTSAHRLVSIAEPRTVAYTRPGADPQLAASWVEDVTIETGFSLVDLAAARQHVWFGAKDGLYDLNGEGDSPNLMGYGVKALDLNLPLPVHYHDNYVYVSLGYQLDRVYVGDNGALQENPGSCAPGLYTAAENEWTGLVTAMCSDQGWLVAAVWNPTTGKTGIYYGKDRTTLSVESPNPLVWHGPEIFGPASYRVTKMRPSSLAGGLRLWICSLNGTTPALDWVSLPAVGTPIADLISATAHRFATGVAGASPWNRACSIRSLGASGGDKGARKIIYQSTVGTRGLPTATDAPDVLTDPYLKLYTRADPAPGSTAWGASIDVTQGATVTLTPSGTLGGQKLEYRLDFFNIAGTATPPRIGLLDAMRREWWRVVSAFAVMTLDVEWGDGVTDLRHADDPTYSPDQIKDRLKAATEAGVLTIRTATDTRYQFKLRQVMDIEETVTGGRYGKRIRARIQGAAISVAA